MSTGEEDTQTAKRARGESISEEQETTKAVIQPATKRLAQGVKTSQLEEVSEKTSEMGLAASKAAPAENGELAEKTAVEECAVPANLQEESSAKEVEASSNGSGKTEEVVVDEKKCKLPKKKMFVPRLENTPRPPPFEGYVRRPKRKVAMIMSYNGKGYHGMQINKVVPTIEGELFKALDTSNAVGKENIDDPHKFAFMRAARTDKGVHAAAQVVSLKMCVEEPDLIEKMNSVLPEQIRIWGFHRTRNSFHAKKQTDSRVYEYLLPTYVFSPVGALWEANRFSEHQDNPIFHYNREISEEDIRIMKSYRISEQKLNDVKDFLKSYEGNRRYHNFTSNSTYKDVRACRQINSVNIEGPRIVSDYEWIKVIIHGNSFVLHQIRKMMGLMILSMRVGKKFSDIQYVFMDIKANIPTAPAMGLLLRKTVHGMYNKVAEDDVKLDFDKYDAKIQDFTEKYIYSEIYKEAEDTSDFYIWIRSVDARSYFFHPLFEDTENKLIQATAAAQAGGKKNRKFVKNSKNEKPAPTLEPKPVPAVPGEQEEAVAGNRSD